MNLLSGTIESVLTDDLFMQVYVRCKGSMFSACILGGNEDMSFNVIGEQVNMTFKETDTLISLHCNSDFSCQNRCVSKVTDIVSGKVMSRITADFKGTSITSIITSASARMLALEIGTDIVCMIKSTSVMLYQGDTTK